MITKNKFLSESELNDLLRLCNKFKCRDSIFLRFILFTASRTAETLEVKKKDLCEGSVTIIGKKKSNDRTIPLPEDFYKELLIYTEKLRSDDLLFDFSTRRARKIWDDWRPNRDKGLHALRHTAAILLFKQSRNLYLVKQILGHRSLVNTNLYLEYVESEEKLKESLGVLWKSA